MKVTLLLAVSLLLVVTVKAHPGGRKPWLRIVKKNYIKHKIVCEIKNDAGNVVYQKDCAADVQECEAQSDKKIRPGQLKFSFCKPRLRDGENDSDDCDDDDDDDDNNDTASDDSEDSDSGEAGDDGDDSQKKIVKRGAGRYPASYRRSGRGRSRGFSPAIRIPPARGRSRGRMWRPAPPRRFRPIPKRRQPPKTTGRKGKKGWRKTKWDRRRGRGKKGKQWKCPPRQKSTTSAAKVGPSSTTTTKQANTTTTVTQTTTTPLPDTTTTATTTTTTPTKPETTTTRSPVSTEKTVIDDGLNEKDKTGDNENV